MSIDYDPYRRWLLDIPVYRSPHVPPGQVYLIDQRSVILCHREPSRWLRLACFIIGRPTPTGWDLL